MCLTILPAGLRLPKDWNSFPNVGHYTVHGAFEGKFVEDSISVANMGLLFRILEGSVTLSEFDISSKSRLNR